MGKNRGCSNGGNFKQKKLFVQKQVDSGVTKTNKSWKAYSYAVILFAVSFLSAFFAASVFTATKDTAADTNDASSASANGYSLSVSTPSEVSLDLAVGKNDAMTVASGNVTVVTTSPGYKLYIGMASDNSALSGAVSGMSGAVSATTGTYEIPVALTNNSWGYALQKGASHVADDAEFSTSYTTMSNGTPDSSMLFAAPPVASQNPQLIGSSTSATSGDSFVVYYGIQGNSSTTAPGVYSNNVVFTAIADAAEAKTMTVSPTYIAPSTATNLTLTTSLYSTASYVNADFYFLTSAQYTSVTGGAAVETVGGVQLSCAKDSSSATLKYNCSLPAQATAGTYYIYANVPAYSTYYPVKFMVTKDFFSITYMQDMTPEVCATATTPSVSATQADTTGAHAGDASYVPQHTLSDIRDGETYRVRKLADGNCWMTENLRLTFKAGDVLTPADTDVSTNTTVTLATQPANQPSTNYYNWGAGTNTPTREQSDKWLSRTTGQMRESDTDAGNLTGENQLLGTYYNWYTATAGSGTYDTVTDWESVPYSICPNGWNLPINAGQSRGWGYLFSTVYRFKIGANADAGAETFPKIVKFPFTIAASGRIDSNSGSILLRGGTGFWNNCTRNMRNASAPSFSIDGIAVTGSARKLDGRTIRCVAR